MSRYLLPVVLLAATAFLGLESNRPSGEALTSYKVDAGHTSVVFKINHLGVSPFFGVFKNVNGSFDFDAADASKNTISIEIKTNSIDSNSAGRDKHLLGPDFFNAEEFPTLTFKSTAWKKVGEKDYDVTGDLTMHGVTKSITIKATHVGEGDRGPRAGTRCGFDATFTIDRGDFDMKYMYDDEKGLGTKVTVMVGVEGVKG